MLRPRKLKHGQVKTEKNEKILCASNVLWCRPITLLEWWFITITELYKRDLLEKDKKDEQKKKDKKT